MRTIASIVLFILISTATTAQKSVMIKYQPKEGTTLKNKMSATMDMNFKAGEKDVSTTIIMAFDMDYLIKDRKDDITNVDLIFNRVQMTMKGPVNSTYDSENVDPNDPFSAEIGKNFKGVIGTPVKMKINTQGKLAEPIDITQFFTEIPANKAGELKEQMTNQMIQFPEHKVKVGESWNATTTMNNIGELKLTYTLKEIHKKTLELSVSGKILATTSETVSMKSTEISGAITLDKKTGETLSSSMLMDMVMGVNSQGVNMNMNMKAEINLTATKE